MRAHRRLPSAVFVYGTLMPDHWRFPAIEHFVASRRPATVPGRLYDTGEGYPAARFDEHGEVRGWLLEIRPGLAGAALATLDQIEGDLYRPVEVVTTDGDEAISYEWDEDVDDLYPLDGEWKGA